MAMSSRSKVLAAAGIAILLWCARLAWDYFDRGSIAHQAIELHLKLFGAAMYEYHSATGQWPSSLNDLARTSLPARSHLWRQAAATLVFLWPEDLKPAPKDNAGVLLIYDRGGLFNRLGRVWVCWGDLRTEHMPERELRARVAAQRPSAPQSPTDRQF
jgi:hypothetical protein